MINEVAYQLVKALSENLVFADRWAGLVTPLKKMVDKREKIFPVAINTKTDCDLSDFMDLVPDTSKKSVIYAELLSAPVVEHFRGNTYNVDASLKLVCWYNLDLITEGNYVDEGTILMHIISHIPKTLSNSLFDYSKGVNIFVDSTESGSQILDRYSYDEVKSQYATFPYGVVAVSLNIKYIAVNCLDDIIPAPACGANLKGV